MTAESQFRVVQNSRVKKGVEHLAESRRLLWKSHVAELDRARKRKLYDICQKIGEAMEIEV
jgi:hypothetical protein